MYEKLFEVAKNIDVQQVMTFMMVNTGSIDPSGMSEEERVKFLKGMNELAMMGMMWYMIHAKEIRESKG